MGTTATPNLNLLKPLPFEEEDSWGPILNTNWDKVDTAVAARLVSTAAVSSVAGLTPVADRLAYYTGASTAALTTLTAFARSLMAGVDAAAMRATLGLGGLATLNSVDLTTQATGILPLANGGTGASTAAAARTSLGAAATVHTHIISDVTGLQTALDGKQAAGSYVTPTDLSTALSPYATTTYVSSALSPYATTSYVNSAVAGVTSATTANVLAATAAGTTAEVGTYAFLRFESLTAASAGTNHAGSGLRYSNGNGGGTGVLVGGGTWKLMGETGAGTNAASASLFLRIS